MNPGGGAGWDEPPLDIQIPDDARELDREVLAYHREQRAQRRLRRLRRLAGPLAGHGTLMPLLASILAVCLVAGAMLSVATFSPATAPVAPSRPPTTAASSPAPVTPAANPVPSLQSATPRIATAQAPGPGKTARSASPSASPARPNPSGRATASRTP